jgi:mannan polymerase II complex MNN10 subunit
LLTLDEDYAQKHGYDFRFHFKGPLGVWDKITNIETAIKLDRYDWIWCIDYDLLITNSTVTLEDVVDDALAQVDNPDDIDMILTSDW